MLKKKVLPVGKSDFRIVRESEIENYYVDKSLMIKDFIEEDKVVTLVTRPRRFGKTLNMTMLREFFDATGDSQGIFEGLSIMDTEYVEQMNTRPVVFLTLKGCAGKTVEALEEAVAEVLHGEYKKYGRYLASVDKEDTRYERFFRVLEILAHDDESISKKEHIQNNLDYIQNSLAYLLEALYTFYGTRPILLIDEYDNPIIEAHNGGFRESFTTFYSSFLTKALKDNPHLGQAFLTGIQRVAKESIFSKLNNAVVYTVLDEKYSPYFGLTTAETRILLEHYGHELNEEVTNFYDGYLFGEIEMYNPWSILNYADNGIMKNYWVNVSTNQLIHQSIKSTSYDFYQAFEKLIINEKVTTRVNLEAAFVELEETETLWGLFVNAGYLTVTDVNYRLGRMTLKIPNEEIHSEFVKLVSTYTKVSINGLTDLLVSLMDGEMDEFLKIYQRLVLDSTSYYDSKENAYHMLFLGMVMNLRELYDIKSNIEQGYGRTDIVMISKSPERPNIIIEFKQGEDVDNLKLEALKQIHAQQYYAGLTGEIMCLGIAHNKKVVRIAQERIFISEEK